MVVSSLCDENELVTFDEAQNSKNWMAAMQSEFDAIMKNGTWSLCDLPPCKKAIGTTSSNVSLMVQWIAIRLGLLQRVMLKKRALILMRPLLPHAV